MNREEILGKVRIVAAEVLNIEAEDIREENHFINDLGAESLDLLTMMMEFEEVFDKSIPDEDAAQMQTVGDAVSYIERLFA
jgi:acyl carrier protein